MQGTMWHAFGDSSSMKCRGVRGGSCPKCKPCTYTLSDAAPHETISVGVRFYVQTIRRDVKERLRRVCALGRCPLRSPVLHITIPEAAYLILFKAENIAFHDPQALKSVLGDDWGHYSVMYDDVCDGTLQVVYEVKCHGSDEMWRTPDTMQCCKVRSVMKMGFTIARYNCCEDLL